MADLLVKGALTGVDFTKAGEFKDDSGKSIKYDNSVKLKTSIAVNLVKDGIKTKTIRQVIIKLPSEDVSYDVERYNKEIGKEMTVNIIPQDGQTFQASGLVSFK